MKIRMIFVDPKKAKEINDIWKAQDEIEDYKKSASTDQKIIGIKEYLESPILEA